MSTTSNRNRGSIIAWTLRLASVAFLLSPLSGCHAFTIQTPSGFGELRNQNAHHYDYRSASANGVVVAVRVLPNEERANLDFWAEVIDRSLQDGGTYRPAGTSDVRTHDHIAGRRLTYTTGDPQDGFTYWVTVFVTNDHVYLLEAGGPVAAFTRQRERVEQSIQSFRPT